MVRGNMGSGISVSKIFAWEPLVKHGVVMLLGESGGLSKWVNNPHKPYNDPSYPHC